MIFLSFFFFFFFNDTATTEIYTLSLHDALPTSSRDVKAVNSRNTGIPPFFTRSVKSDRPRSEEHTSELQSQFHLVCRLLLEKKKNQPSATPHRKKKKKIKQQ